MNHVDCLLDTGPALQTVKFEIAVFLFFFRKYINEHSELNDNGTGPDGSFDPVVARNSEVLASNSDRFVCLSTRLCIYSAPNCSKACIVQRCLL